MENIKNRPRSEACLPISAKARSCAFGTGRRRTGFYLAEQHRLLDLTEFEETLTAQDFSDVIHGIEATCLLQHRIATGSILMVKSRKYPELFRVREENTAMTEITFLPR